MKFRPQWKNPRPRSTVLALMALVVLMVLGAIAPRPARSITVPATVDYGLSGHTLALLYPLQGTQIQKIRLQGIITPDRRQAVWGDQVTQCLQDTVPRDADVQVEVDLPLQDAQTDQYDRLWAYVRLADGRLVNQVLVEEGCAAVDIAALPHSPYQQELHYSQERARILGLGIWNPDNPWHPDLDTTPLISAPPDLSLE